MRDVIFLRDSALIAGEVIDMPRKPAEAKKPAAKPPKKPTARQIVEAVGIDDLCRRIETGESQTEIARSLGVEVSTLNEYLHSTPENSARARAAMEKSAESWIDRGHQYLVEADSDPNEIARAKALEQHCARRAAIRNPRRYSQKIAVGGAEDLPPVQSTIDVSGLSDDVLKAILAAKQQ